MSNSNEATTMGIPPDAPTGDGNAEEAHENDVVEGSNNPVESSHEEESQDDGRQPTHEQNKNLGGVARNRNHVLETHFADFNTREQHVTDMELQSDGLYCKSEISK